MVRMPAKPAAALVVLLTGSFLAASHAAFGQAAAVDVRDYTFVPQVLEVEPGTTVTWTQSGTQPHSVTADPDQDEEFDSHPECSFATPMLCMQQGETFQHTFDQEGTFAYFCRIHGDPGFGMHGTIIVGGNGDPGPGDPQAPVADAGGPYVVDEEQPLVLDGGASTASEGRTIEAWAWDVTGDGTPDLFGETAEHTYDEDGEYQVTLTVTDDEGSTDSDTTMVTVRDIGVVDRAAGDDRVATAVAVSSRFWDNASEVLLATARNFPDALAAGPLAAALDAPLLLTEPGELPGSVAAEFQRLGAQMVTILGGPAAVSEAVADDLRARGYTVRRVEGANRFGTARAVAGEVGASATREVVVALGQHADPTRDSWPDALSAGALSASPDRLPILLTGSDEVPPDTETALAELDTARVFLLGGTAAISTAVAEHLAGLGYEVRRLEGVNRFATSVAVAAEALTRHPAGDVRLVFATGSNFPDGLTAGALGARVAGLVVLVPTDALADVGRVFLEQHARRFDHGTIVGGPAVVTEMVRGQLQDAMTAS